MENQELDNALGNLGAQKTTTRFDFKGSVAEILYEKDKITLTAEDAARLRGLREIVIGKLSKRGVDLRNVEQVEPAISPLGHARQELKIKQGLGRKQSQKDITGDQGDRTSKKCKVNCKTQLQVRVTGKKRDVLQAVIQFVRTARTSVWGPISKIFRD